MAAPESCVFRVIVCFCAVILFAPLPSASGPPQDAIAAQEAAAAAQSSEERAAAAAQAAQGHAEVAERARSQVTQASTEAVQNVRTVSAEMIDRAQWLEKIASLTIWFFGVVGIVSGIAAAFGVGFSLKKIKASERQASADLKKIDEIKVGVQKHHLFLKTLEEQVSSALKEIESKLSGALTPAAGLIGVDLGSAVPQRSYDDDALIVFADRLRITGDTLDAPRMSEFLVMTSNYWRRAKEYNRAIERAQRAIELNGKSPTAYKAYGRALWNKVAEELSPGASASSSDLATLAEATTAIEKAKSLLAQESRYDEELAFDLATIARLSGHLALAEQTYRQGLTLSQELARNEDREPDWDFAFALACLYAVSGRYQDALDELKTIVKKTKSWRSERRQEETRDYKEWTQADPDFRAMLTDGQWRNRLDAL